MPDGSYQSLLSLVFHDFIHFQSVLLSILITYIYFDLFWKMQDPTQQIITKDIERYSKRYILQTCPENPKPFCKNKYMVRNQL